ncbi:MAG: D-alanine--D-alanine ligase [Alicyclobacillus macrosporangiidus]|uniref:D-alanine--D-alanine ligase family protein n=1 Tax=Alicyclobacillus macrosporangiidus TaxID=392015 RepID=UPI0026F0146E|nr:D-alanine--D-alanine ligase family protein [Alicyclobacillus macrosporangiidus]MCL6600125.1 D-alanine--D-alanine ligase [Alicyclobacillus macrosporangiidus]
METIAVIFGGRSVEHEVSVVTGLQVMENLDRQRFTPLPVYIAKDGVWYSHPEFTKVESFRKERLDSTLRAAYRVHWEPVPGNVLRLESQETAERKGWFGKAKTPDVQEVRVDAVIPATHGTYGEDGALQGFLELTGVPYTSAGVLGSAVGMDKIVMKSVFRGCGIPVVPYEWFTREAWERDPDALVERLEANLSYPMFVKPCNLGSSVGISRAENEAELRQAIEIAQHYDTRILVEQGIEYPIEVNVSVIGDETTSRVSLCERPLSWEKFLTYDDKYIRGNFNKETGASREIPAQLPDGVTERVQALAQQAFHAVQARGVVRVDFLVTEDHQVFVNEINTIPGSFAFYLWEPAGMPYKQLLAELIDIAKREAERKRRNITSFDSDLLEKFQRGTKLGKA